MSQESHCVQRCVSGANREDAGARSQLKASYLSLGFVEGALGSTQSMRKPVDVNALAQLLSPPHRLLEVRHCRAGVAFSLSGDLLGNSASFLYFAETVRMPRLIVPRFCESPLFVIEYFLGIWMMRLHSQQALQN